MPGTPTAGPAPVWIESIAVRDFRGLSVDVELDPELTVLVGRNNSGKSRLLRSIAIATGASVADHDDFSLGTSNNPEIDVVIAPLGSEELVEDVNQTLKPVLRSDGSERFAWRTRISRSSEGDTARRDHLLLGYDVGVDEWFLSDRAQLAGRRHSVDLNDRMAETEVRLQLVSEALDTTFAEVDDLARRRVRPPSRRMFGRDSVESGGFRASDSALTRTFGVGEGGLERT